MRQPRPQGTTFLSTKHRESGDPNDKDQLFRHLITIYSSSGFRWNNEPTSIPELSQILQIPQAYIMDLVSQVGQHMGSLASPENIKNTLQSIVTLSTSFALQDRGLILKQLDLLLESQGDTYKPFVSSEVNKTLKLALDSNKNISDLYKSFFTNQSSTTNILIQSGQEKESEKEYLSPDQALNLITQESLSQSQATTPPSLPAKPNSSSLAETSNLADELHNRYSIGDLETVKENRAGTEALLPADIKGPPANQPNGQAVSVPTESHQEALKRRGYEVLDADEIA